MSVQRDHRQDALLSLASWVDGRDDVFPEDDGTGARRVATDGGGQAASLAELLRRRGRGEAPVQPSAAAIPALLETVAQPEATRSVPPRLTKPAVAAKPSVSGSHKGLFARIGSLLPGRRRRPSDMRARASVPEAIPQPAVPLPDMSFAKPAVDAGPASDTDITADYFDGPEAEPATVHPEADIPARRPRRILRRTVPTPPRDTFPLALQSYRSAAPQQPAPPAMPYLPHPAAPWLPGSMPTPASAHFYWPVGPIWPPQTPHAAFAPWQGGPAMQPAHPATQPANDWVGPADPNVVAGNGAARAELEAEIEAVRERLHDFAAMLDRLRAARSAG